MKRFLCTFLLLILLPVMASAETFDLSVNLYNAMATQFGLKELQNEDMWETVSGDSTRRTFHISDNLEVVFYLRSENVYGFGAVALSPEAYVDFLAACSSGAFVMVGDKWSNVCSELMISFFYARAGKESQRSVVGKTLYGITNLGDGKIMFLMMGE